MAATGARCLPVLRRLIVGERLFKAHRQAPYLIPMPAQHTGADPARTLYTGLDADDGWAEIAMGFPAADIRDAGPALVAHAPTQNRADALADALLDRLIEAEPSFDTHLLSASDAVDVAMADRSGKPVVIADVQDHPGAGASSDSTALLEALRDRRESLRASRHPLSPPPARRKARPLRQTAPRPIIWPEDWTFMSRRKTGAEITFRKTRLGRLG